MAYPKCRKDLKMKGLHGGNQMNIEGVLMERIKRFEDIKNQIAEVSKKIGGLTEQQRALYNQGLELKGSIDTLVELKAQENQKASESKTASLILPEGVKPVAAPEAAPVEVANPVAQPAPEAAKQPVSLEVQ
jgi:hypothetical protein